MVPHFDTTHLPLHMAEGVRQSSPLESTEHLDEALNCAARFFNADEVCGGAYVRFCCAHLADANRCA